MEQSDYKNSTQAFAQVIEWSPHWSSGAPMPQVFSNGLKTFLIYHIHENDPNWDGSYVTMVDNTSEETYPLALVEFIKPHSHKFGTVNDEAANGHPLFEKGLELYSAHTVENSNWIEELKTIHKVHPYYNEDSWDDQKHFLLFFHDEMFEIIAEGYTIETHFTSFLNLATEAISRINA